MENHVSISFSTISLLFSLYKLIFHKNRLKKYKRKWIWKTAEAFVLFLWFRCCRTRKISATRRFLVNCGFFQFFQLPRRHGWSSKAFQRRKSLFLVPFEAIFLPDSFVPLLPYYYPDFVPYYEAAVAVGCGIVAVFDFHWVELIQAVVGC